MGVAELSDCLRWLEAIHYRHVAVHQDQEIVACLLSTGARVPQPVLFPFLDLFKSKKSVECTIRIQPRTLELRFYDGLGGNDIEDVVINNKYLWPLLARAGICLVAAFAFLLFLILLYNQRTIHESIIAGGFSLLEERSLKAFTELTPYWVLFLIPLGLLPIWHIHLLILWVDYSSLLAFESRLPVRIIWRKPVKPEIHSVNLAIETGARINALRWL